MDVRDLDGIHILNVKVVVFLEFHPPSVSVLGSSHSMVFLL